MVGIGTGFGADMESQEEDDGFTVTWRETRPPAFADEPRYERADVAVESASTPGVRPRRRGANLEASASRGTTPGGAHTRDDGETFAAGAVMQATRASVPPCDAVTTQGRRRGDARPTSRWSERPAAAAASPVRWAEGAVAATPRATRAVPSTPRVAPAPTGGAVLLTRRRAAVDELRAVRTAQQSAYNRFELQPPGGFDRAAWREVLAHVTLQQRGLARVRVA